ncbi:hypothetical protein Plhal304r1_c027g0089171 [Plasmopara halstedii]
MPPSLLFKTFMAMICLACLAPGLDADFNCVTKCESDPSNACAKEDKNFRAMCCASSCKVAESAPDDIPEHPSES